MPLDQNDAPCLLVTGASRNIGRAIALAFGKAGFRIAAAARSLAALAELRADCAAKGYSLECFAADFAAPGAGRSLASAVLERCGRVDVMIANAAVRPRREYLDIDDVAWRDVLQIDLTSIFEMTQTLLPAMVAQGGGRIIAIGGLDAHIGNRDRAHVVAAKAGLAGLIKALALEFSQYGITANTVAPGVIDTMRDWRNYPELSRGLKQRVERLPVRRLGRVEEVAAACLYLASQDAGYVTGQTIHMNGGEVCF